MKIEILKLSCFFSLLPLFLMIFLNLSYPLMWNDEAETAVYAQRILKYGYPKVNDEGKILNLTEVADKGVGVKENLDAWIHLPWLQYYLAALPEFFAGRVSDVYLKTFILRFPFALIGFCGVVLFGFSFSNFFKGKKKYLFLNFFYFLSSLSTSLILHLREVRSYPLTLFLLSLFFYYFTKAIRKDLRSFDKSIFLAGLFLLFNSYPPAYFSIFAFTILLFLVFRDLRFRIKNLLLMLLISLVFIVPLALFYETFRVSLAVSKEFGFNIYRLLSNIFLLFKFLSRYEYLYLFLFLELIMLFYLVKVKIWKDDKVLISLVLLMFLIIYVFINAMIPYFFERYFIFILLLLPLITLINIFWVVEKTKSKKNKEVIVFLFIFVLVLNSVVKIDQIYGKIYEAFYKYQGPMDFAILYIKDNFKDPRDLIIATNYEEPVFLYYLGSKVVVGYTGANLEEDSKVKPDVIIIRKGRPNNLDVLNGMLKAGRYKKISFFVYDYQFNNVPELSLYFPHLFRTKFAAYDFERLNIYIRDEN